MAVPARYLAEERALPAPAGTGSPRWTLVTTSFGLGMALLDMTAVNVAVPSIEAGLGTDVRGLSWVIDGYTLTLASLLLLAGGLGDRLGARRLFLTGLALFTVASAACGFAPGLSTLVLARVVQGAGAALFLPSSLAILREAYPHPKERAHAIGIWSGLTAIAGACGPLFGGAMIASLGWRSIFLLNVPVGIVAVAMVVRFVRPSPTGVRRGFDLPAQLTGAFALAAFTWALIERPLLGWGSLGIQLALLVAAFAIAGFIFLERRSPNPILPLQLFANRTFSATSSAALLYAAAFFGGVLVLSIYFQELRGDSPIAAGLHMTAITVSFGLTSVAAGRLAGRVGTRTPILLGLALLALGAGAIAALPQAVPFGFLAVALALIGMGAGLVAPSMNSAILASVPPALSGIGGGVLNASRQVGTALGVALFASLFHGGAPMSAVRVSMASAGALYLIALAVASRAHGQGASPASTFGNVDQTGIEGERHRSADRNAPELRVLGVDEDVPLGS
jgi:DHA2 family methylenomycin A resistance protein-like MFS transporter